MREGGGGAAEDRRRLRLSGSPLSWLTIRLQAQGLRLTQCSLRQKKVQHSKSRSLNVFTVDNLPYRPLNDNSQTFDFYVSVCSDFGMFSLNFSYKAPLFDK